MVERFIKSSKVIVTGEASFCQILLSGPNFTQRRIFAIFCDSVRSVGPLLHIIFLVDVIYRRCIKRAPGVAAEWKMLCSSADV